MPTGIHLVLAWLSGAATLAVALEAGWRALANRPSSQLSNVLVIAQLVMIGITSLAGLAIVAGGTASEDGLHYLLAVLALALQPGVSMFTTKASMRVRAAAASVAGFVGLAVVYLLFATG